MDNNTTLDQRSLPWTIKSSMKVVHEGRPWTIFRCPWTIFRCPWATKPSYTKRTNTQHLEDFRLSIAVTKPVTIAMNPLNKLTSVSGYNFNSR